MKKQDLAKLLNITPSAISAYISGRNEPDLETLFKICDILGTDIKVIVGLADYSATITDIDLKERNWAPIGSRNQANSFAAFTGTFDGKSHTIFS